MAIASITLDFTKVKAPAAAKTPVPEKASPARHLDSTVRTLDAARDLIVALRLCDKAVTTARREVDEKTYGLVTKLTQHLYCASELAKQLQQDVDRCAAERLAFWKKR